MRTEIEKQIVELGNNYCNDCYKILKRMFEENPGKKMVFSGEVGYRKITEIAPFGTYLGYKETSDGKWESYDTGKGAGHLMCKEHYIHGERWCDKALDAYYACVNFWFNLLQNIIYYNDIHKEMNEKEGEKNITFDWVDNDMTNEHWSLGC